MRLVADPLRDAQSAAPEEAERVGCESEPSFSRALKRRFGVSPAPTGARIPHPDNHVRNLPAPPALKSYYMKGTPRFGAKKCSHREHREHRGIWPGFRPRCPLWALWLKPVLGVPHI